MEELWIPTDRAVIMEVGPPKIGKTGSVVPLVNAGYRVIVAAFDPGYAVLRNYVDEDKQKNLILLPFEDRRGILIGLGDEQKHKLGHGTKGEPLAFIKFGNFLNDGKARTAKCQGGELVDFGDSEFWGPETILVVDNLTSLTKAIMARCLFAEGRNTHSLGKRDWGLAQAEADSVLMQMASSTYTYNLIVLAHIGIHGPEAFEDETKSDHSGKSDFNNELRRRQAALIPTKLVPKSLGRALSRDLSQHFPTVIWAEKNQNGERGFNLRPTVACDYGMPVKAGILPDWLPIETGLHSIFNAVTGKPR